jgi:hypothetical protein
MFVCEVRTPRSAVGRFEIGQKVLITGAIITKHRGRKGTVISVQPSRYTRPSNTSLDKYLVQFEDGDQVRFFDIQLVPAAEVKGGSEGEG